MVASSDWERTGSCINCGIPVTIPTEEIPEHLVSALEMHECRDNDAFGTGAAYGALSYGAAMTVFTFLPAAWLNWELQGSWKLLIQPAVVVTVWTVVGAIFGAVAIKVLSAILAPSRVAFQGAVRGMVIGFTIGALLGVACIFVRNIVLSDQSIDIVWLVHSDQVTGSSILVGSLFAVFGSWAGAILTGPGLKKHQRVVSSGSAGCSKEVLQRSARSESTRDAAVNASRDRFQFGISRMLFLTATIAVTVAIPVQVLAQLRKISQLANDMIAFEVMLVLFVILISPFVAWATVRGPTIYARLVDAWTRWHDLKHIRP